MNANGAPSIFGAIPGAGGVGNATRGENEHAWWKILEDAFEYAFETYDADLGWVPTLEQATDIRTRAVRPAVKARDDLRSRAGRGMPQVYAPERIQGWFERWYLYYPFIDEVAVTRALGFHRDAWEVLTTREHRTVLRRLAAMRDPYEAEGFVARRLPGEKSGWLRPYPASPRASRWLDNFTNDEKKVLFDLVQRHRRTLRGE